MSNKFSTELMEFFEANGACLINLDKAQRKAKVAKLLADAPKWVERASDIASFYCAKQAVGYKIPEQEKYRAERGSVYLAFDGKYWSVNVALTQALENTDEGQAILKDMGALDRDGKVYYNVASRSSERRHCEFMAKAIAVWYKLAHSPSADVPSVDMKDLQNKERRQEVYKYAAQMKEVTEEPTAEPVAEGKTKKKEKKGA